MSSSASRTSSSNKESAGRFATIAAFPSRSATASSRRSSRRSPSLESASGPWHWKQLSDRIGRMSRLKSTALSPKQTTAALAMQKQRASSAELFKEGRRID